MKYILIIAFLISANKNYAQTDNDSTNTKSSYKVNISNKKNKNGDSIQIKTMEEISGAINSINNFQKQIKEELVGLNYFQDELKKAKEQNVRDSQLIKRKSDSVFLTTRENMQLKIDTSHYLTSKRELQKEFDNYKKKHVELGDSQIEYLLNSRFDKEGNPPHNHDFLMSYTKSSQGISAQKIKQLKDYIEICDSFIAVKKIFEVEYKSSNITYAKNSIKNIQNNVRLNLPKDTVLTKELIGLTRSVDIYCQNTNELFAIFRRIYPIAEAETPGVETTLTPFRKELDKAFFYVRDYPYLKKLLNYFKNDKKFREDYKNREPIICN